MAPRHNNLYVGRCRLGEVPGRLDPGVEYRVVAVGGCFLMLKLKMKY